MSENAHRLSGPHFVVSVAGDIHGEDTEENREIVRRIHACVNACGGISTEELEKGIIQDMRRVIAQIAPLLADKKTAIEQRIQQHKQQQAGRTPAIAEQTVPGQAKQSA